MSYELKKELLSNDEDLSNGEKQFIDIQLETSNYETDKTSIISSEDIYKSVLESVHDLEKINNEVKNVKEQIENVDNNIEKFETDVINVFNVLEDILCKIDILNTNITDLTKQNNEILKEINKISLELKKNLNSHFTTGIVTRQHDSSKLLIRACNNSFDTYIFSVVITSGENSDNYESKRDIKIQGKKIEEIIFEMLPSKYSVSFIDLPNLVQIRVYEFCDAKFKYYKSIEVINQ